MHNIEKKTFCKRMSHFAAKIAHPQYTNIWNTPHPKHPTSWTSRIPNISHSKHPTSQICHIPNMPHPEYPTFHTCHAQNFPHPKYLISWASHIPYILHPEYYTFHISHISDTLQLVKLVFVSLKVMLINK